MTRPDFRKAQFATCSENPFRLTPPSAQANTINSRNERYSAQASSSAATNEAQDQPYPDPPFSDILAAFKDVFSQRKAQGMAFLELTNSELMLVKKSLFVTVCACLAALVVTIVCWLLLNLAIGTVFHALGVSYVVIPFVLLAVNIIAAFGLLKLAQSAFHYVNFHRLIQTWRRVLH